MSSTVIRLPNTIRVSVSWRKVRTRISSKHSQPPGSSPAIPRGFARTLERRRTGDGAVRRPRAANRPSVLCGQMRRCLWDAPPVAGAYPPRNERRSLMGERELTCIEAETRSQIACVSTNSRDSVGAQ